MAFMQKQIIEGIWYQVETLCGTVCLTSDIAPSTAIDFCDACDDGLHYPNEVPATVTCDLVAFTECEYAYQIFSLERVKGFGARLSAPGYLDATEWAVFDTEQEASDYLADMYDNEY